MCARTKKSKFDMFHINLRLLVIFLGIVSVSFGLHPSSVKLKHAEGFSGRWTSKTEWRSQLIREWIPKTIYVPFWKRVWTPVVMKEWVPSLQLPLGKHPH